MTTKRRAQPHNAYNIFFILERKRLIYELEGSVVDNHQQMSYDLDGYENLCLPNLPPKFQHLHLPPGWFVPGKNSKRKHAKTHGIMSFLQVVRTVGENWRNADQVTKDYCLVVANKIRDRYTELSDAEMSCRIAKNHGTSVTPPPKPYSLPNKSLATPSPPTTQRTASEANFLPRNNMRLKSNSPDVCHPMPILEMPTTYNLGTNRTSEYYQQQYSMQNPCPVLHMPPVLHDYQYARTPQEGHIYMEPQQIMMPNANRRLYQASIHELDIENSDIRRMWDE